MKKKKLPKLRHIIIDYPFSGYFTVKASATPRSNTGRTKILRKFLKNSGKKLPYHGISDYIVEGAIREPLGIFEFWMVGS